MRLTTYFRSTAAYRVRIALNLKGLEHELVPIHLLRNGGEHHAVEFLASNPEGLIPTLETQGRVLTQSIAILEYLEEVYPEPAILPSAPLERAYLRGIAQSIASDIHPLNNLRVLQYLQNELDVSEDEKLSWYRQWVGSGFEAIETRLNNSQTTDLCCFGNSPTLADICLIPQVYNANRFDCSLDRYPTICRINDHCLSLQAFADAMPHRQTDCESS